MCNLFLFGVFDPFCQLPKSIRPNANGVDQPKPEAVRIGYGRIFFSMLDLVGEENGIKNCGFLTVVFGREFSVVFLGFEVTSFRCYCSFFGSSSFF